MDFFNNIKDKTGKLSEKYSTKQKVLLGGLALGLVVVTTAMIIYLTRPNYVKVHAFDENMEEYEIEGTELMARAMCHEIDHLDGKLFVDYLSALKRDRIRKKLEKQTRLESHAS